MLKRHIVPCTTLPYSSLTQDKTAAHAKIVTLSSTCGHSWLTCVINVRNGQAILLRKKSYLSTLIISERVHSGNTWVSACQESRLNSLTHYTNCVLYSFVCIVCTNYGNISKIRFLQLCQLCNSSFWFFISTCFQLKNITSGCYLSTFRVCLWQTTNLCLGYFVSSFAVL